MNIVVEIWSSTERKTFPMYANFAQDWIPSDMKQQRLFDKNLT